MQPRRALPTCCRCSRRGALLWHSSTPCNGSIRPASVKSLFASTASWACHHLGKSTGVSHNAVHGPRLGEAPSQQGVHLAAGVGRMAGRRCSGTAHPRAPAQRVGQRDWRRFTQRWSFWQRRRRRRNLRRWRSGGWRRRRWRWQHGPAAFHQRGEPAPLEGRSVEASSRLAGTITLRDRVCCREGPLHINWQAASPSTAPPPPSAFEKLVHYFEF